MLDVYNRSSGLGDSSLNRLNVSGMTLSKFRSDVIGRLSKSQSESAEKAMQTASLINKLETDTTFIGQTWRSQKDQTLRGAATVDTQVLDAMMRDPDSASLILDRLAVGGSGRPTILLSGTQSKSVWQEIPFVGIDKDGNFRVVGNDGFGFSRVAGDTGWTQTQSNNPNGQNYLPKIEWKNEQWKFNLADGSDFNLGDTRLAQVNINGVEVTLDADKSELYKFAGNGDLYRSATSPDGNVVVGEILTGQYARYTFSESVNTVGAAGLDPSQLYASYASSGATSDIATARVLYLNDGKGKEVTIDSHPVLSNTDTGSQIIGTQSTTTVKQNGITQSSTEVFVSTDKKTINTDALINSPTGQFQSQSISTTAPDSNGNPISTEQGLDANGAQINKTITSVVDGADQTQVYGPSNQLQSTTTAQTFDDGTQLVTIKYPSGVQTLISTDILGGSQQVDYPVPNDPNIKTITNRDATGNITGTSTIGLQYDTGPDGIPFVVANAYSIVNRDGAGSITATGQRVVNPLEPINPQDAVYTDSLINSPSATNPTGSYVQYAVNSRGETSTVLTQAALNDLSYATSLYSSGRGLINAIRNHDNLGIGNNSLSLANNLTEGRIPELGQVSGVLGAITGVIGLNNALGRGDAFGTVFTGSNLIVTAANGYASAASYGFYTFNAAGEKILSTPLKNALNDPISENIFGSAGDTLQAIDDAIPYLTIANDLANGNIGGAIGYAIGFDIAGPLGGTVGEVIGSIVDQLVGDIFGLDDVTQPPPTGTARVIFGPTGSPIVGVTGILGGDQVAGLKLDGLLNGRGGLISLINHYNADATTNAVAATTLTGNTVSPILVGLVPQRLGSITSYGDSSFASYIVNATDPATGQDPALLFSSATNRASNADVHSPAYFQTLEEYYLSNALARQAVAPGWEVATAKTQQDNGLSNAGLSEVERAANLGHLAAAIPTSQTTEHFNPIAIDLNGDGLGLIAKNASNVYLDIDGTADLGARLNGIEAKHYRKHTAWLNSQDGLLILDKNINGNIDNGEELFSNSAVNEQSRGVASLVVLDADGNGVIDAADPVLAGLGVWQDKNSNGLFDSGEVSSLADLGITSLNYLAGTVTRNGQDKQLSTLTLDADTLGTSFMPKGDGMTICYEKRSCWRPSLLGWGAKRHIKQLQKYSKRTTTGRGKAFRTQKSAGLAMKSGYSPIFTGARSYEIKSK